MKKISVIYVLFILLLATQVKANSEVQLSNQNDFEISLQNGRVLKVCIDQEVQIIKLQILDSNNGTQKGEPLLLFLQEVNGFRPKVALIPNMGFALCWIGTQIEQPYLFLQIFRFELNIIIEQQKIAAVNQDVIWDFVSEFHYLEFLSGTKLQVFYKSPYIHKKWWGLVFDIINPQKIYDFYIPDSQILNLIVKNENLEIDIFQKIDQNWYRQVTLVRSDQNQGQDTRAIIKFCQICSNADSNKYNCEQNCQDGCQICLTQSDCLICEDGYTLDEQKCEKNECKSGCQICNIQQECIECEFGYQFSEDKKDCLAKCPENCITCTQPPICDKCEEPYIWIEHFKECIDIIVCPYQQKMSDPIVAILNEMLYIAVWYQDFFLPQIVFQIYKNDGSKYQDIKQVIQETELETTQQSLFFDLATFEESFVIFWLDQIVGDMKVKIKRFDFYGNQMGEEITITALPRQKLEDILRPCLIKKINEDSFVTIYQEKIEEKSVSTIYVQCFNLNMEPNGNQFIFYDIDYTKSVIISANKYGRIFISYASQGQLYLINIDQDVQNIKQFNGNALIPVHLENNQTVLVLEQISSDFSPPQYLISIYIMIDDQEISQSVFITSTQSAEFQPYVQSLKYGFVVVWRVFDSINQFFDIVFQLFDNLGNVISDQIKIDKIGSLKMNPKITFLNDQDFIITWTENKMSVNQELSSEQFTVQHILNNQNKTGSIICSQNCLQCYNSIICIQCQNGYIVENGQCQLVCGDNCISCSQPDVCDFCQEGFQGQKCSKSEEITIQIDKISQDNNTSISWQQWIIGWIFIFGLFIFIFFFIKKMKAALKSSLKPFKNQLPDSSIIDTQ